MQSALSDGLARRAEEVNTDSVMKTIKRKCTTKLTHLTATVDVFGTDAIPWVAERQVRALAWR